MELERKTPLHVATHLVGLDSRVDVATHLVGLDSRVDDVMRHLEIDANDVQMIGIHRMGGIGKTTLAKEVFDSMAVVSSRTLESFQKQKELSNYRDNFLRNFLIK
ncbi:hypothetical protein AMTR_s00052p00159130 [Amborella trichopoda]|uniref:NB-ARC domain-containing protein n=1 Tax=Amborella trichopoda TaxID=13333 RepID=U5CT39_AMBTC|nr:hypothetical protein AMTR_s00052p00159130 [Amborella trichopoda]